MPNESSRPYDSRCPVAFEADPGCEPGRAPSAPGVCLHCELGTCSGDGAPMTPEQCAESRRECPTPHTNEVYCPACLAEIVADRAAAPEVVEEEASCAQTVRLDKETTTVPALAVEWCDKQEAAGAA